MTTITTAPPAPLYGVRRRSRRALVIVAVVAATVAGAVLALVLAFSGAQESTTIQDPGPIARFHADAYDAGPDIAALQRFHADAAGK